MANTRFKYAFVVRWGMGIEMIHNIRGLEIFASRKWGLNINPHHHLLEFLMDDILKWVHARLSALPFPANNDMVITVSGDWKATRYA